jgi:hypothetical protein
MITTPSTTMTTLHPTPSPSTTSSNHAPLTHPDLNHSHPTLTPTLLNYYDITVNCNVFLRRPKKTLKKKDNEAGNPRCRSDWAGAE